MALKNLQEKQDTFSNPFEMLYNNAGGGFSFPVAPEISNWRDEHEAWRSTAILQDMTWHMTEINVEGPDVYSLIKSLAVNSFKTFGPMTAKQFVACNYDGYLIGDAIMTSEKPDQVTFQGRPSALNWVAYHVETGGFDVKTTRYENPTADPSQRKNYRYQIQGPTAGGLFEEMNGGPLPDIGFFKMGKFNIGPHEVTALNHRMSGAPGFEIWGPMEEAEAVKAIILETGEKFDLRQIGGRSYPVTAQESGWMGGIVPAIYTGEKMKPYREWLSAKHPEATWPIGGSFVTDNIEELYLTPYDVGYGFMVKYNHAFIGREALEKIAGGRHKKKVRLYWEGEDIADIYASMLSEGERYKYMEMPSANYATYVMDEVTNQQGERIGLSIYPVYSANLRSWISLASIDADYAVDGQELTVTWGEPNGGSSKPRIEPHVQKKVRVRVDSKPVKRA